MFVDLSRRRYPDLTGILESYRWILPSDQSRRRYIWLRYSV